MDRFTTAKFELDIPTPTKKLTPNIMLTTILFNMIHTSLS